VEFEPAISEGEQPQTYALDRAATGRGSDIIIIIIIVIISGIDFDGVGCLHVSDD
jgi:hypothetical protein